jgi:5-(carboxyamino)imidazole ribonucleotide synthase
VNGVILPGATIGVLGSGQLGRMFAIAARRMGYRVHTFSPDYDTPTGQVADKETQADYEDLDAVRKFATGVDVITFEFENIPAAAVEAAASFAPVRPDGAVLYTTQNRLREKMFLASAGFPVAPFRAVRSLDELNEALAELGQPAVLKTAGWGYDGKGQSKILTLADAPGAWQAVASNEAVVEKFVDFECEVSVVAARSLAGDAAEYDVIANAHVNHILDVSSAPAGIPPSVAREAAAMARAVLESLEVVGVLCVEFFVTRQGGLVINELAPRPHNSGHLTFDACITSQFEQQLRAICGLALGSTELVRPAAMANLLGDLWHSGTPNWAAACRFEDVKLHLYGKETPRPGRKMGHLTVLSESAERARETVLAARNALGECPS